MLGFFSGSLSWDLAAKVALGLMGLVASSISFIKWWSNRRCDQKAKKQEAEIATLALEMQRQQIAGMRAMAYVYELMDDMSGNNGCCDRVVVFNGHNGGMLPDPSRPYYVSAIHSAYKEDRSHEKRPEAMYRKILVDTYYVNMLLECFEKQWVLLTTDKMPDSLLRDFYTSEGVTESLVFYLKTSGNSFVFGSTSTVGRGFNNLELLENRRMINLMRTSMTHIGRSSPY